MCCGITVRLAAVPQHLHEILQHRAVVEARVGRLGHRREVVEVDAAGEQRGVVGRGLAQHGAGPLRRHRRRPAAEDAALAPTPVPRRHRWRTPAVRRRPGRPVSARSRSGWFSSRAEELEVHERLLHPVGQRRHVGQVLQDRHGVRPRRPPRGRSSRWRTTASCRCRRSDQTRAPRLGSRAGRGRTPEAVPAGRSARARSALRSRTSRCTCPCAEEGHLGRTTIGLPGAPPLVRSAVRRRCPRPPARRLSRGVGHLVGRRDGEVEGRPSDRVRSMASSRMRKHPLAQVPLAGHGEVPGR